MENASVESSAGEKIYVFGLRKTVHSQEYSFNNNKNATNN
jgi:hypothetical protein